MAECNNNIAFVKGRLNISSKSATAANNVQRITMLPQKNYNILPLQSACISVFFITSFSLQTYFSTTLILEGAKNYTRRLINLRRQLEFTPDRLSTVKKQTYEAEIKKSIFFANSSPEAIVQKALFTCKIKQKITPDRSAEF